MLELLVPVLDLLLVFPLVRSGAPAVAAGELPLFLPDDGAGDTAAVDGGICPNTRASTHITPTAASYRTVHTAVREEGHAERRVGGLNLRDNQVQ